MYSWVQLRNKTSCIWLECPGVPWILMFCKEFCIDMCVDSSLLSLIKCTLKVNIPDLLMREGLGRSYVLIKSWEEINPTCVNFHNFQALKLSLQRMTTWHMLRIRTFFFYQCVFLWPKFWFVLPFVHNKSSWKKKLSALTSTNSPSPRALRCARC